MEQVERKFVQFVGLAEEVFSLADIADDVIEKYKKEYSEMSVKIHNSFLFLRPDPLFYGKHKRLFRVHCIELLDRLVNGNAISCGTKAEHCLMLSSASEKSPLKYDAVYTYEYLFSLIFDKQDDVKRIYRQYRFEVETVLGELCSVTRGKHVDFAEYVKEVHNGQS